MAKKSTPPETVEPVEPLQSDQLYWLAFWGGIALAAGVALARFLVKEIFQPNPDAVAPLWGGLGFLAGILTGSAMSLRPQAVESWLLGAATSGVLSEGVFGDWDSFQLLFRVSAVVCVMVVFLLLAPLKLRLAFFGGCLTLHFLGILSAVTSPSPQPWISGQAWNRIFRPYLHFTYMNNAYQFYSPDPGPARQIWFCVEYYPKPEKMNDHPIPPKDGEKGYFRWIKIPMRPGNYSDPLGQAYFRRLSVTEYTAQFAPMGSGRSEIESKILEARRNTREDIPRLLESGTPEYQPPTTLAQKSLFPSYIRHIAWLAEHPDFDIRSIKFYRATHRILGPAEFRGEMVVKGGSVETRPVSPFDPTTLQVYFQGAYDKDGNLLNPADPLLFWNLPIRKKPVDSLSYEQFQSLQKTNPAEYLREYQRSYMDYVNLHAGYDHQKEGNLR